jgi:hypothetical protein
VVSFTPRPLYPQEKTLGIHWIGGSVGPRAVLDAVVKRNISSPHRESKRIRVLLVIYGCETWSLIVGEEHSLKEVENKVLTTKHGSNR